MSIQQTNTPTRYVTTTPMAGVHTWFPVTTPTDPVVTEEDIVFKSCPADDGKTFTTTDGTFYRVKCQAHTIASNTPADKLKTVTAESFTECMEKCSETLECISIDYVARTGDHVVKTCDLYKTGGGESPTTTCQSSKFLKVSFLSVRAKRG